MQDIYEEKNEIELEDYEIVYQTCDYQVLMTSLHFHDAIEMIYVIEGEFFVTVNDKEYTLKPGRMVFINAKEIHSVYTVGDGLHRSIAIKFLPEITGSGSQSFLELKYVIPHIMTFSNFKTFYEKKELENSSIKNYINGIIREYNEHEPGYKLAIRIYISAIVLKLLRQVNSINLISEDIRYETIVKFSNIFQYISTHYAERLTSLELAKLFNIRPTDFSGYFKKITGKSFNEYLNYIRIYKAKRLLVDSEKNISEIAYEIGFSTPSYFINCFRTQTGITPMAYKQANVNSPAKLYYSLVSENAEKIRNEKLKTSDE